MNSKYRYEWDSPPSAVISFTFMMGSKSNYYYVDHDKTDHHANMKYCLLATCPARRFNEIASVYALLRASYNKVDYNYNWKNHLGPGGYINIVSIGSVSQDSTSLVYGTGVQITPLDNFVIDVGYEVSTLDDCVNDHATNGFNIGVDYRF